jgi:hypothetical protein
MNHQSYAIASTPHDNDDLLMLDRHRAAGRDGSVCIPALGTAIWSLAYDVRTRTGTITMPASYCTSMDGAVRLFLRLDPEVAHVVTIAGGLIDTTYERVDGLWRVA